MLESTTTKVNSLIVNHSRYCRMVNIRRSLTSKATLTEQRLKMIENSIRAFAIEQPELNALINSKFHLSVGHNSKDNYVLLRVINDSTPIEVQLENNQSEATVQFDCYSLNPQNAQAIAKAIDNIFNKKGFSDTSIKVQFAKKESRLPDFEPDSGLYRESLDYVFYYNEV